MENTRQKFKPFWDVCFPIILLLGLVLLYLGLMVTAYSMPAGKVNENFVEAWQILDEEGDYPSYILEQDGSILDNYTDRIMVTSTIKVDEVSTLFNALIVRGYARYWHGYLVWLRPLLSHVDYYTVRLIISFIQGTFFLVVMTSLQKRFGLVVSLSYGISWVCFYSMSVVASLQYFSCYLISYIGMLIVTWFYYGERDRRFLTYLFLIIGSITNFMDLLTFPLVTLSLPLIIVLLVDVKEKRRKCMQEVVRIIYCSAIWGVSYAMTWVTKWLLAKYICNSSVVESALKQASYRMNGDETFQINRKTVLLNNINTPMLLKFLLVVLVVLLVIWLVVSIIKKKNILNLFPFVIIGVMPYVWYEVMCNHSMQHRFFAYRAQMGTLFLILMFIGISVEQVIKIRKMSKEARK